MTRYGQIGWRVVAVAAFVGTAALAIILTRAPVRPAATLPAVVASHACPTSGLKAWLGSAAPGAGNTYYTLEFTNVSHRPCSLYGYPEVSAYGYGRASGAQVGGTAIRDTSVRPRTVMLAPGATAHSVLRVMVTGSPRAASCAQVTVEQLRVTLPHQGRPAIVPVHIPVCSGKGHPSLSVQAIQARPGVPGYTMLP